MTAGFRSTEFWLIAAVATLGAALTVAGLVLSLPVAIASGAAQQAIAAVAYAHSRGRVKAGDAPTDHERDVAAQLRSPHRVR